MSDVVVDAATITQVLFDFSSITNIFILTVLVLLLVFCITFNTIAIGIKLASIDFFLGLKFLVTLHFLHHDLGTELLQEFVGLLKDLHKT